MELGLSDLKGALQWESLSAVLCPFPVMYLVGYTASTDQ